VIPAHDPPGHGLLAGRVAVVTAAAGTGIGGATARRLALEGASVVLSDVHERRLDEAVEALAPDVPGEVHGVVCDVSRPEAFEELFDEVASLVGLPDVVVNNAGLGGSAPLHEMTDEQWRTVMDVSLWSVFRSTRSALRRMGPRGSGTIVNVASVTGWRAESGQAHYAAAKAGVMALTRCAAVEAAPHGVRVVAVAPTLARHPFLERVVPAAELDAWAAVQPQGRAAEPGEVASVIAALASGYASYVTGEVVSVGALHA
jgi:3-oxoacyl-[acyl-carrier protein] reductase